MALEIKDVLKRSSEASLNQLQSKEFPQNLQPNWNIRKVVPNINDIGSRPVLDGKESAHPVSNVFPGQTSGFNSKPMAQNEFGLWNFYPTTHKIQLAQMNAYWNQLFRVTGEDQFPYAQYNMCAQGFPYNFQFQDFKYFVVIDFEATCDKGKIPDPQEIIEFPSVIVSGASGALEGCFQTYVRPTCNKLLSEFCKDLTGIQQNQVDAGVTLSEALVRHDRWLENRGIKNSNFVVVTWSNWDCRVMLESECRLKKIKKPHYFNRWINLKVPFCELFGVYCKLQEAVAKAGLAWEGRLHSGLDDAKNTARLLAFMMRSGVKFKITNSLVPVPIIVPLKHKKQLPENTTPPPAYNNNNIKYKGKNVRIGYGSYPRPLCHCGAMSSMAMVRKPGPKQGSGFFGCGNWTANKGARCSFFQWATTA